MRVRILVKSVIHRFHADIFQTLVGNKLGILFNTLRRNSQNLIADNVIAPVNFLLHGLGKHFINLVFGEKRRVFGSDFLDDIGKNYTVRQLVAVNIFDFIGGADHQRTRRQIIKEIKSVVKIDAFQQIVGHQHPGKVFVIALVDKILINLGNILVALQQNLVIAPAVINTGALFGRNDAFDDVSIALRMNGFLISLNSQNQINFRRRDIIADVWQIVGLD